MSWTIVLLAAATAAQPFQPGTGFAPLGNLRTTDRAGPYNLTLLPVQANELRGERAATLQMRCSSTDCSAHICSVRIVPCERPGVWL